MRVKIMIVTFFGHSNMLEIEKKEIEIKLLKVIKEKFYNVETIFYLGDYGSFDFISKKCCLSLKNNKMKLVYITPYLEKLENEYIKQELKLYNEIIYPELEKVPKRYAILERNKWMVKQADYIIFYINHSWGGAYKMLEYAKKIK